MVARYYQAADVYAHAARAETFPNTILEALSTGAPVVATAVGGIPEQVKGLKYQNGAATASYSPKDATGVLTPPGDAEALANALRYLLSDDQLLFQLGENAARDARLRFSRESQAEKYMDWYEHIRAGR
jgi:glycosyltransferase involved in cell wall biosynthesis